MLHDVYNPDRLVFNGKSIVDIDHRDHVPVLVVVNPILLLLQGFKCLLFPHGLI